MDGQESVVGRVESDNESRFDQEPPEEAQVADVEEDDPAADVSMTEPGDIAEEPSLSETLDLALTPGAELEEEHEVDVRLPRLQGGRRRHKHVLTKKEPVPEDQLKPEQRLLLLDTWRRSGLPAGDFGDMVGVSKHTLYAWKKRFDDHGPAGLMDRPRKGAHTMKLADLTKRTILMLKEANPSWGCQRISDMLLRGPALPASATSVAKVLKEAGYELKEEPTDPHPDHQRSFERVLGGC